MRRLSVQIPFEFFLVRFHLLLLLVFFTYFVREIQIKKIFLSIVCCKLSFIFMEYYSTIWNVLNTFVMFCFLCCGLFHSCDIFFRFDLKLTMYNILHTRICSRKVVGLLLFSRIFGISSRKKKYLGHFLGWWV